MSVEERLDRIKAEEEKAALAKEAALRKAEEERNRKISQAIEKALEVRPVLIAKFAKTRVPKIIEEFVGLPVFELEVKKPEQEAANGLPPKRRLKRPSKAWMDRVDRYYQTKKWEARVLYPQIKDDDTVDADLVVQIRKYEVGFGCHRVDQKYLPRFFIRFNEEGVVTISGKKDELSTILPKDKRALTEMVEEAMARAAMHPFVPKRPTYGHVNLSDVVVG